MLLGNTHVVAPQDFSIRGPSFVAREGAMLCMIKEVVSDFSEVSARIVSNEAIKRSTMDLAEERGVGELLSSCLSKIKSG